jgi:hypothetical protein
MILAASDLDTASMGTWVVHGAFHPISPAARGVLRESCPTQASMTNARDELYCRPTIWLLQVSEVLHSTTFQ